MYQWVLTQKGLYTSIPWTLSNACETSEMHLMNTLNTFQISSILPEQRTDIMLLIHKSIQNYYSEICGGEKKRKPNNNSIKTRDQNPSI